MPAITVWSVKAPLIWARCSRSRSRELRGVDRQRVRSEAGDAGHLGGIADEIDGEPLLGAGLGEVEAARRAAVELGARCRRSASGPLPGRGGRGRQAVAPLQPAGPRQVNDQVQPIDVEIQELAVAARGRDR